MSYRHQTAITQQVYSLDLLFLYWWVAHTQVGRYIEEQNDMPQTGDGKSTQRNCGVCQTSPQQPRVNHQINLGINYSDFTKHKLLE